MRGGLGVDQPRAARQRAVEDADLARGSGAGPGSIRSRPGRGARTGAPRRARRRGAACRPSRGPRGRPPDRRASGAGASRSCGVAVGVGEGVAARGAGSSPSPPHAGTASTASTAAIGRRRTITTSYARRGGSDVPGGGVPFADAAGPPARSPPRRRGRRARGGVGDDDRPVGAARVHPDECLGRRPARLQRRGRRRGGDRRRADRPRRPARRHPPRDRPAAARVRRLAAERGAARDGGRARPHARRPARARRGLRPVRARVPAAGDARRASTRCGCASTAAAERFTARQHQARIGTPGSGGVQRNRRKHAQDEAQSRAARRRRRRDDRRRSRRRGDERSRAGPVARDQAGDRLAQAQERHPAGGRRDGRRGGHARQVLRRRRQGHAQHGDAAVHRVGHDLEPDRRSRPGVRAELRARLGAHGDRVVDGQEDDRRPPEPGAERGRDGAGLEQGLQDHVRDRA